MVPGTEAKDKARRTDVGCRRPTLALTGRREQREPGLGSGLVRRLMDVANDLCPRHATKRVGCVCLACVRVQIAQPVCLATALRRDYCGTRSGLGCPNAAAPRRRPEPRLLIDFPILVGARPSVLPTVGSSRVLASSPVRRTPGISRGARGLGQGHADGSLGVQGRGDGRDAGRDPG